MGGNQQSAARRYGPLLGMAGLVFAAYTATLSVAQDASLPDALSGGAANTVPVMIFGALAYRLIVNRLAGRSMAVQLAGHAVLCAAFAFLSFWFLLVLLGLANGASPLEFSVHSFSKGNAWQVLENVTTYGIIAALAYVRTHQPAPLPAPDAEPAKPALSVYFTRSGEDIRPVDLDRVVCISGADDYAEVTTLDGKHLVRMTLAEFERTLDATRFARVHRSWIVNFDCIERVEEAGAGRMLLHMKTGQMVPASRSGAKLLRDRVI